MVCFSAGSFNKHNFFIIGVDELELVINGEKVEISTDVETVSELLQHFSLNQKVVIVELNHEILEKGNHQETRLSNGDRVEIVHFVGGG
jgi:sulfur carrier protein